MIIHGKTMVDYGLTVVGVGVLVEMDVIINCITLSVFKTSIVIKLTGTSFDNAWLCVISWSFAVAATIQWCGIDTGPVASLRSIATCCAALPPWSPLCVVTIN